MLLVLIVIWLGFNILTGGVFLSARNLFNLSLQVSVVGIMACGMVLVIVARQIDFRSARRSASSACRRPHPDRGPPDRRSDDLVVTCLCDARRWCPDRVNAGGACRLRRHAFVRRHAGRPAVFPQRRLPDQRAAGRSPPSMRRFSCSAAVSTGRSARSGAGSSAISPSSASSRGPAWAPAPARARCECRAPLMDGVLSASGAATILASWR